MPVEELKKIAKEIDEVIKENAEVTHERDRLQTEVDIERVGRARAELRSEKLQKALETVQDALVEAKEENDLLSVEIAPTKVWCKYCDTGHFDSKAHAEEMAEKEYRRRINEWEKEAKASPKSEPPKAEIADAECAAVKKSEGEAQPLSALQEASSQEATASAELRSLNRAILFDNIKDFLYGNASAVLRTLALATGIPAVVMTVFNELAARWHIYVEPLRSWWQPWVPQVYIYLVILAVTFAVAFAIYRYARPIASAFRERRRAKKEEPGEPKTKLLKLNFARKKPDLPPADEEIDPEALQQLMRLFKSSDDDEKPKLGEK